MFGKELQCDRAIKPGVLGLVDNAHTSNADPLEDSIVANRLADESIANWILLDQEEEPLLPPPKVMLGAMRTESQQALQSERVQVGLSRRSLQRAINIKSPQQCLRHSGSI